MELNILIEGDDNRQMIADSLGRRLSKSAPFLFDAAQFANNLEALKRKIAKPDTIQFDNVSTPEVLADCVVALRDYRLSVVKLVVGVFVCAPGVIVLSNRVPIVIEGHADAEQEARLREQVAEMGSSALGNLLVKDDAIKFEGPGEDVVEDSRPPLSQTIAGPSGTEAYSAATLVLDGRVVCEAKNIMHYKGTKGRAVLFEKGTELPSGFIEAANRANDHYFRTRTFEKKSFNPAFVRPASITEVQEYLTAKYEYEKARNSK